MTRRSRQADLVADVATRRDQPGTRRTNLKALLGTEEGTYQIVDARMVPVARIERNPNQPRQTFDDAKLDELADSIRRRGILQPIRLRRHGAGYQIVAGERRFRAAQLAGLVEVPAIVVDQEEGEAYIDSLIENVQREDLNPLDRAEAWRQLRLNLGSVGWKEVGSAIGLSERSVFHLLNLRQLPEEMRRDVRSGELTEKHGRALHRLRATPELQREAYAEIVERRLTGDEALALAKTKRLASVPVDSALELAGAPALYAPPDVETEPGPLRELLAAITIVENLAVGPMSTDARRQLAVNLERVEQRIHHLRSHLSSNQAT